MNNKENSYVKVEDNKIILKTEVEQQMTKEEALSLREHIVSSLGQMEERATILNNDKSGWENEEWLKKHVEERINYCKVSLERLEQEKTKLTKIKEDLDSQLLILENTSI